MRRRSLRRILVLTADAGFGHRCAANAIAAALREKHGTTCTVEVLNPLDDERVPPFLRDTQTDYDKLVRKPELYKLGYRVSDAAVTTTVVDGALTVLLYEVMRDLVERHRPHAIVTTYPMYHSPLKAVYTVSKRHIPLLAVVTDLGSVLRIWYHEVADLYLVATEAVRAQALAYGLPPQRVWITGIPVHPDMICEDRAPAAARAELGWDPDRTTVLAVGSKRVTNLYDALRALNHSGMPLQLALVAGGDDELYQRLLETTWHVPATVHNFVDNMPTLMRAADCILCKAGGMIVSEALACGLPLLLVDALPGQEAGNAEHVIKGGAGELVRDPLALLETLHHWLDEDGALLAQRAENARRLGQPRAAYVIADLAWEAARRGPRREGPLVRFRRSKLREQLKRDGIL